MGRSPRFYGLCCCFRGHRTHHPRTPGLVSRQQQSHPDCTGALKAVHGLKSSGSFPLLSADGTALISKKEKILNLGGTLQHCPQPTIYHQLGSHRKTTASPSRQHTGRSTVTRRSWQRHQTVVERQGTLC